VLTDDGPLGLDVPRDREGTFEPRLIGKHERRFTGFDDKIVALYARGMTVREIQAFLAEMYAIEVSPDLISTVTDAVVDRRTQRHERGTRRRLSAPTRSRVSMRSCGKSSRLVATFRTLPASPPVLSIGTSKVRNKSLEHVSQVLVKAGDRNFLFARDVLSLPRSR
jgi:hypothetical protein